ncbi:MAG: RNA 2'-phosphotransferase [Anaerolineae bacterium]|jgi:putative RNA 2'-phosphotransferase|nr:RNA 2'-phosphotransferase [Anaerolineae bacterium]MBT7072428.1 RNA 2'-phosphotransferase [Anaerolineae bacterium]MBT7326575.1 RNA 2'-phosphotransferase [Anaerolineae bacterium]
MTRHSLTKLSKFLSLVLRHRPEKIGLSLDTQGWANVDALLTAINKTGTEFTRETLEIIVTKDSKQRYSFSPDGKFIRANQGHSIDIDLGLEAIAPPEFLYHGTAERFLPGIRQNGLQRKGRQHVHLSSDEQRAFTIGQRHGKPVVLVVLALKMHIAGHKFYLSENGVWLTREVLAGYLFFPLI